MPTNNATNPTTGNIIVSTAPDRTTGGNTGTNANADDLTVAIDPTTGVAEIGVTPSLHDMQGSNVRAPRVVQDNGVARELTPEEIASGIASVQ